MNHETGRILITLARSAIDSRLCVYQPAPSTDQPWLQKPGATYVTLLHDNKLRGRTGTRKAHRALSEDLTSNAIAAACSDLRFLPEKYLATPRADLTAAYTHARRAVGLR